MKKRLVRLARWYCYACGVYVALSIILLLVRVIFGIYGASEPGRWPLYASIGAYQIEESPSARGPHFRDAAHWLARLNENEILITKEQARESLGEPDEIREVNGVEFWKFDFSLAGERHELVLQWQSFGVKISEGGKEKVSGEEEVSG